MPVEQRKAGRWRQRTKERRKHAPRMSSGLKSVKRNASMQTFNWCSASVGRPGNRSHPLLEPETSLDASADLLWRLTTNWRAECQKLACSVRREGRPHPSSLPLSSPGERLGPISSKVHTNESALIRNKSLLVSPFLERVLDRSA